MAIFNLEDNEDAYIAPRFYSRKFHYKLIHITSEIIMNNISTIDLRTDKLMVYGTEIEQSKLDRLHESLVLRPKSGIVFVNCNGGVYFYVPGKGCYRPIQNNIFDWSHFGVVVPNSALDSLRKQNETNQNEVYGTDELKEQLSTCQKDKQEVEMKLQKVCGQLSSLDFELENHKIELETVKKIAKDLQDELYTSRKESETKEEELEKVRHNLLSINSELQSSTTNLEASNKRIMELEEQLSMVISDNENNKIELNKVQEQLSTRNFELEISKTQLDSFIMRVKELEKDLSSSKKERQDMEQEMQKVQNEVSSVNSELDSMKIHLQSSKNRVEKLEEKLTIYESEGKITKTELERVRGDLSMAQDELQSTKNKLETYERQVQELKDKSGGSKTVIDQLKSLFIHFRYIHQSLPSPCSFISQTRQQDKDSVYSLDKLAISIPIEEVCE